MALPVANPGAQMLFTQGELATETDLERMGSLAAQTAIHLMARLFQETGGTPTSGFFEDDCKVTASGLTATVATGWGFQYDSAATATYALSWKPIVVSTAQNVTINAHDASNIRHDIIAIKADTDDDQNAVVSVYDLVSESWSAPSTPKRRVWSHAIEYVPGTASATPTDPATPSGYIAIARIRVPAVSGAVSVDDLRPMLQLGRDFARDPGPDYAANFVPGNSTECSVAQTTVASMKVNVLEGEIVMLGKRYRVPRTTLTVSTADATNPRIDVVSVDSDGVVSITAGTPASSPSAPSISATSLALANVAVGAAVTSIVTANITDRRVREPITGYYIRDAAIETDHLATSAVTTAKIADSNVTTAKIADANVTTAKILDANVTAAKLASNSVITAKINDAAVTGVKLSVVPVLPVLTIGAETSNARSITIQAKDPDGNNVARTVRMELQVIKPTGIPETSGAEYTIAIGATGTEVIPTNGASVTTRPYMMLDTNSSGQAQVTLTDVATGTNRGVWLKVTPFNTMGYPALGDCGFN